MILKPITVLFAAIAFTCPVAAICNADCKYGIGGAFEDNRWNVYDLNCNVIESITGNPCSQPNGVFSCTTPPVVEFVAYKNTVTGDHHSCFPLPGSGSCGVDIITICCNATTEHEA